MMRKQRGRYIMKRSTLRKLLASYRIEIEYGDVDTSSIVTFRWIASRKRVTVSVED
jgi:hypothetical protein